jgi:O-antigen/teichoic acid export membrane protein
MKNLITLIKTQFNYSSKFSTDTMWLILSQIVLISSGFLINILIGVKFGSEKLGIFNQVIGYYTIFSTMFSIGLNNSIIKSISTVGLNKSTSSKILTSNLILTAIFSILLTAISLFITKKYPFLFSSSELAEAIVIPLVSLPFFNINKNFMAYYTGTRNQKMFSLLRSIRWLLIIIFIIFSICFEENISIFLYSFLFAEVTIFFGNLFMLRHYIIFKIEIQYFKSNFYFGLKSFTAELLSVFNDQLDLIIIAYYLSKYEVGVYSFFIFFTKSLYIFPGIIQQNLNPIISKYWSQNRIKELQLQINKIRKINQIVVGVQVIIILLCYYIIINYIKLDFKESFGLLIISLIGAFPFSLILWSGSILVMTGKLNENIYRTLFILIFSVSSSLILSSLLGLIGSTIAISINSIMAFILMKTFVKKSLNLKLI